MKKIDNEILNTRVNADDNSFKTNPTLYSLYHELMTIYFMKALKLDDFEKEIDNSGLGFKNVTEDNMDVYQYLSSDHLKYFYIRNNLKLENLSSNEINYLKNISVFDNNTIDFLNNTIMKVIHDNERDKEIYAPVINPRFLESCDKIVIGFRYDEFADTNLSDDSWAIQNEKQYNFLNKKLSALQENINQKNFPVRIFEYDDSLVIPFKDSNEKVSKL